MTKYLDIVFDGPPGPVCGRFVEVEDDRGRSRSVGEWIERGDGLWALRIPCEPISASRTHTTLRQKKCPKKMWCASWDDCLRGSCEAWVEANLKPVTVAIGDTENDTDTESDDETEHDRACDEGRGT